MHDGIRPGPRRRDPDARGALSPENLFYAAMSLAIVCAVVLGFARSFFLRPLFRGWAEAHSAPETFFYFHGAIFTAWLVLLPAQSVLVATGRMRLHRRLGRISAWVAMLGRTSS